MFRNLITLVYGIICFAIVTHTFPVNDNEAVLYLQKFGYLEPESEGYRTSAILGPDAISSALKDFQRFAGLNQTGEMDNATIAMMNTPRCGVKDKIGHSESARKKRYALQGSKWRATQLTYRVSKYPSRIKDKTRVDKEIARAFKIWSDVTTLNFEERRRGRVSIDISFENGEHGDGDPFDGPGKTLAHAFFPQYGGDAHFDNEEKWTIDERTGTNMFQVAAHEFGHSLGLSHTDERQALMAPYYRGYQPYFKLHSDDIDAIQSLYGSRNNPRPSEDEDEPTGPPPDISDAPDLCQDSQIDTVTRTQNGSTYAFKGDFYWKILSNGIADGYPRKLSDDWDGLEGNLDASMTWSNGKTYFFKGGRYWRFTNKEMDTGYPKLLYRGFEGIPDMLDAAVVWSGNGKTYFFKGDKYWRYDSNNDPPVSDRYPRPITNWNGLPVDGIDAAFQWENSRTYFFKDDKYYRFNDITFEVDSAEPPYPRSTSIWWFDCKSASNEINMPATNASEENNRDNITVIRIDSESGYI